MTDLNMTVIRQGYWITDGETTGVFVRYRIADDNYVVRQTEDGPVDIVMGRGVTYATAEQVEATGFAGTGFGKIAPYGRLF